jgi:GNAT superfamily N-acetyltransferase
MSAAAAATGPPPGTTIVQVDHPSFARDVEAFLIELRDEPRYFGPTAATNPKPFPSQIEALRNRGGFRVAAVETGRIVGLARVDGAGELTIAVVADRRGCGIGRALTTAALRRAGALHYRKVTLRTTHRAGAAQLMCEALGALAVERGDGRIDLVMHPVRAERDGSAVTPLTRIA